MPILLRRQPTTTRCQAVVIAGAAAALMTAPCSSAGSRVSSASSGPPCSSSVSAATRRQAAVVVYELPAAAADVTVCKVEGGQLMLPSTFPYFILVALEVGGLFRGLLLLLLYSLYPVLLLLGHGRATKLMVMVSFADVRKEDGSSSFRVGSAVMPKLFLEDPSILHLLFPHPHTAAYHAVVIVLLPSPTIHSPLGSRRPFRLPLRSSRRSSVPPLFGNLAGVPTLAGAAVAARRRGGNDLRRWIWRRRPREGRIRRPRKELGSRRRAAGTVTACSGGSGGAVAEAEDSGAPETEGPSGRPAARRWRSRGGGPAWMGSVEVAVTWYGGGRESMRGGSGKGVNARGFRRGWRRGSHCGGSSPPAARCSARRKRLPRTSTSRWR
nr:uncharacterized protein LOC112939669 [Oryza sativa Japonica Group]